MDMEIWSEYTRLKNICSIFSSVISWSTEYFFPWSSWRLPVSCSRGQKGGCEQRA